MQRLFFQLQEIGCKIVLAITGGGTGAINELLKFGGGSKFVLEAIVPYSQTSFDSFVKGKPDKYCSDGAARDLAMASFQRAVVLAGNEPIENIVGVGATCSLSKDGEREGREHKAYIAIQMHDKTISFEPKVVPDKRVYQEDFISQAILAALASSLGIKGQDHYFKSHIVYNAKPEIAEVVLGRGKVYSIGNKFEKERIIFPGAFNPIHEQHIAMAKKVSEIKSSLIDIELCVRNVDKPALNYMEIENRLNQFDTNMDWLGQVHLTGCSTFAEKSNYFPNCTFLVGWDTFVRINDPKYGNLYSVIQDFKTNNIKFMVFHRILNGKSTEDESLDLIHPEILKISEIFGSAFLPPVDISSSEIRKRFSQT